MSGFGGSFRDLAAQCGDPTDIAALSNSVTATNAGLIAETKIHTQHTGINPMEVNPMLQHPSQRMGSMTPLLRHPPPGNAPTTSMMMHHAHMANLQQQQAQMMMDQMFEEFQDKLKVQQQQQQQQQPQQSLDSNNNNSLVVQTTPTSTQRMGYGPPRTHMYGPTMGMMPQYHHPMMMMPSTLMRPSMMPLPQQQQIPYSQPQYIDNAINEDQTLKKEDENQILNEEKEREGISTNGTEEMKDEATVQDELDSLNPSDKDLEAIRHLLRNTEDEHMQNTQLFNLLRQLESKKAFYNDSSFDTEQLASEWERQQQSWYDQMGEVAEMDPLNAWKPTVPPYEFQKDNPYLEAEENETTEKVDSNVNEQESSEIEQQKDNKDYMAEGLRLMKEGHLNEAILAFEACIKKEPNRSEAWRYLGQCHADNENEKSAIATYLRCYELDPYDLDALLALGVSYTNESDFFRAVKFLREWIMSHPEFSVLSQEENSEELLGWGPYSEHKQLVDLFVKALEINSQDPDLHAVLGVLYNITKEFDKAELHFKRALQKRPNDPSLWNKLGATQANGQKCQQAINAYSKALELKPNYVRALSNLGISFVQLNKHQEACQTYLASLRLNPRADPVWDNLSMALTHMGRDDLMKLAEKKDITLFQKHFDF